MFKRESMHWLTGYDTFGYRFFHCLVAYGELVLRTRAPDLRQARVGPAWIAWHSARAASGRGRGRR